MEGQRQSPPAPSGPEEESLTTLLTIIAALVALIIALCAILIVFTCYVFKNCRKDLSGSTSDTTSQEAYPGEEQTPYLNNQPPMVEDGFAPPDIEAGQQQGEPNLEDQLNLKAFKLSSLHIDQLASPVNVKKQPEVEFIGVKQNPQTPKLAANSNFLKSPEIRSQIIEYRHNDFKSSLAMVQASNAIIENILNCDFEEICQDKMAYLRKILDIAALFSVQESGQIEIQSTEKSGSDSSKSLEIEKNDIQILELVKPLKVLHGKIPAESQKGPSKRLKMQVLHQIEKHKQLAATRPNVQKKYQSFKEEIMDLINSVYRAQQRPRLEEGENSVGSAPQIIRRHQFPEIEKNVETEQRKQESLHDVSQNELLAPIQIQQPSIEISSKLVFIDQSHYDKAIEFLLLDIAWRTFNEDNSLAQAQRVLPEIKRAPPKLERAKTSSLSYEFFDLHSLTLREGIIVALKCVIDYINSERGEDALSAGSFEPKRSVADLLQNDLARQRKQNLVFVCGRGSGQTSLISITQSTCLQANSFLQKNQSKGKKEQVSSLKKLLVQLLSSNLGLREGVHFHQVEPSGIVIINMGLVMQGIKQKSESRSHTTLIAPQPI